VYQIRAKKGVNQEKYSPGKVLDTNRSSNRTHPRYCSPPRKRERDEKEGINAHGKHVKHNNERARVFLDARKVTLKRKASELVMTDIAVPTTKRMKTRSALGLPMTKRSMGTLTRPFHLSLLDR